VDDFAEMDWLHDASFEDEVVTGDEEVGGETIALSADDGATQVIDSILNEFEDDQAKDISLEGDSIDTDRSVVEEDESEGTIDLVEAGATQELANLLNAFSDEDDKAATGTAGEEEATEKELTGTQHLDNLLGEFSDDDDVMFAGDEELITPLSAPDDVEVSTQAREEDDEVFGATQHLGVLMGEFTGNEEETGELKIGETAESETVPVENIKPEIDHGATQQLDHLLGEFLTDDESAVTDDGFEGLSFDEPVAQEEVDEIEVDHCATQELDHLLSSFADDDEDDDSKKE